MAELVKLLSNKISKKQGVIQFSESVSNIQFSDTRAYVTTNNKCYKCEYVIVAVPPPESVEITVQPSLSPTLTKVQTLFENGTNLFFTATFRQEFLNDNYSYPMNIITTPDCDSSLKLVYDATHSSNKSQLVLAGFLNESNFQTRRKFKFFNTLNKCFRGNAAQNCIDYKERKWMPFNLSNNQESIRGGSPMSFLIPCDFKNYFNPLSIRNGRIFYAASEYAKCWPGTVDGAIEAGKITSLAILWQMRPQSLNKLDLSFFRYLQSF
ncbi:amine oxidase [flavin-containing] A-like [Leptopilina heterotoma]|uniref:amine oxidase [flavin-containing] A-like n=1 Tax=Leptopilina heterotoma TaxID=63436 RepID=UPI001CA8B80B|nr:amine oxidase [flavin-containing] A-like [Leptopilina heterotoma]